MSDSNLSNEYVRDQFVDAASAANIVRRFKVYYADQYNQRFLHIPDASVAATFLEFLSDIKIKYVANGFKQLRRHKFMPNFAEFRQICIESSWFSVDQAWAMVLSYEASGSGSISRQALDAYSEIRKTIEVHGHKFAFSAFKEIYLAKIDFCLEQGIDQVLVRPATPKLIESNKAIACTLSGAEQRRLNLKMVANLYTKIGASAKKVS